MSGMDHFLFKPFKYEDLFQIFRKEPRLSLTSPKQKDGGLNSDYSSDNEDEDSWV
jgi:hypothetical protein